MTIPRPRSPRPALVAALAAATVLLAGCTQLEPPNAVTPQGGDIRSLYVFVFTIAVVVFVFVEALIVFTVLRYRRKPTDTGLPAQIHGNNKLEVIWTAIPAIIVLVMFVFSYSTLDRVNAISPSPDIRIRAVAAQFQWTFEYLSPDGQTVLFEQLAPEMTIPAGKTVHLTLRSKDVIHAFYVPQFLFKRDVVPGRENNFDFSVDAKDAGQTFRGQCAELCGVYHGSMVFAVKAVTPDEYASWLKTQVDNAAKTPAPQPSGAAGGPNLDLEAKNTAYDKASLEAPADAAFTITFKNDDPAVTHNVEIKDATGASVFRGEIFQGVDSRVYPVPALKAGTYTYNCTVHPNMTGTLTVR